MRKKKTLTAVTWKGLVVLQNGLIFYHHRRRARAFRALTVKAHFVVQSDSVVHWRQKKREKKKQKKERIDKRKEK